MNKTENIEDSIRDVYGEWSIGYEGNLDRWLENGAESHTAKYRIELHENLSSFYRWGTNYDPGNNPFNLFRDIVGWSEEVVGTRLYTDSFASVGYLEASYIAEALKAWSTYPLEVELWLNILDLLENQ